MSKKEKEMTREDMILQHLNANHSTSTKSMAEVTGIEETTIVDILIGWVNENPAIPVTLLDNGDVYFGMTEVNDYIRQLEETVLYLRDRKMTREIVVNVTKPGRKDEVLTILQSGKHYTIPQIAKLVGINDRNVSSQLSYLRKAGHRIATDSRGAKFLEN